MSDDSSIIIQRLWNYCNVLRDDGVSYSDYVEQLTYLIFLKMIDEQSKFLSNIKSQIPAGSDWQSLISKTRAELIPHYQNVLKTMAKQPGLLGVIFGKSQNKINDPSKLKRLIELIENENWIGKDIDVKAAIYEGLLEKNAEDVKSGAGQYFTPRPLIKAIVKVIEPVPGETIYDPACGTGGFLLAAFDYLSKYYRLDGEQIFILKNKTFKGMEIVDNVARLCAMNLYLREIGREESPIEVGDSLFSEPSEHYNIVLTNPPFGKKGSFVDNGEKVEDRDTLIYNRRDFAAPTSNKQLNFVQHVKTLLKDNGRAAIVIPDNVLFEGGASEVVRRKLLEDCDVHTILRLPTGIFYASGVKANVLFFDKIISNKKPITKKLWIYDLRTNKHFTLKTKSLGYSDLQDFIRCYNSENRHQRQETERFKSFSYDELMMRDKASLDILWLKDESLEDSDNLPDPAFLAREIVESLETALEQFRGIEDELKEGK